MARRRSQRRTAVENLNGGEDDAMDVEDPSITDDADLIQREDGGDNNHMDDEADEAEDAQPKAGGSERDDDDDEEQIDASFTEPANPEGDHTDAMNVEANAEVNLEADTSIGAFRPSRRAAVEATKKIEATKANIKDNATKENKSKGKGKGKAKAVSSEEDSDEEEEVVRPKQKKVKKVKEEILSEESDFEDIKPKVGGKKQVLAKAVYWKDIPKWEKGSGSLLMGLPGDVMDIIFGLREELGLAEYVALAGVCKVFRHHLDDDFFQAVCLGKGRTPKTHYDDHTQAWVSRPETKGTPLATAPFSRGGEGWRIPRPRKYTYTGNDRNLKQIIDGQKPVMKYYTPRGKRSTWSQAQYTVYKEEQKATGKERWAARKTVLDAIAKDVNERTSSKYRYITDGHRNRTVLGEVAGRKNGQPAIQKDDKGMPIAEAEEVKGDASDSDDESSSSSGEEIDVKAKAKGRAGPSSKQESTLSAKQVNESAKQASLESKAPAQKSRSRKRAHVSESENTEDEDTAKPAKPKPKNKSRKIQPAKEWVVPDSSDESTDEQQYMRDQGLTVIHDHWPSPWRIMAAAFVNTDRINKSNAMKDFKVTEAQLLTLKHHLVPNPMNNKQPMQLYIRTAVEALALRAHGGIAKHGAFMTSAKDKSRIKAEKREVKIMDMVNNGTYVHKQVDRPLPRWAWGWGERPDREDCVCADCNLMDEYMGYYDSEYRYLYR